MEDNMKEQISLNLLEKGKEKDVETKTTSQKKTKSDLLYTINDRPPIYLCLLLGFQHYITMYGGTIAYPYLLAPALCIKGDDPARGYLISTLFFTSGLATLAQTTFGIRLPLVQGSAFSFLLPTLSFLNMPENRCPNTAELSQAEYEAVWMRRMRIVQGGLLLGALVEVVIGATGVVGLLLKKITPLVIIPTITQVGLSMFMVSTEEAGKSWLISGITIAMLVLFTLYLPEYYIPVGTNNNNKTRKFHIFKLFPVLLAMLLMWFICMLCTVTNVFPAGHPGRTDGESLSMLYSSSWFRAPYPLQWGIPIFTVSAFFSIISAIFVSIFESVGDYYACARLSGAPSPPKYAINRGIFMEGIGCVFAAIIGSGTAVTSFSENIGAIAVTKVGSRRVLQWAGLLMIGLSCFVKLAAVFATIPVPIMGGVLIVLSGIISSVGLSTLRFVDLTSSRNLFILGLSLFMGLSLPHWMRHNPGAIVTFLGVTFDQSVEILLQNAMLVSGFLGFVLDNTVPGSDEERGLTKWLNNDDQGHGGLEREERDREREREVRVHYKIPFIEKWVSGQKWLRSVPIFTTFQHEEDGSL